MKIFSNEAEYEALRAWAGEPCAKRPVGLAQILRAGLAVWLQTAHPLPAALRPDHSLSQAVPSDGTPLSTLIAAMIAEVFA